MSERCPGTFNVVITLDEDRPRLSRNEDSSMLAALPGAVVCGAHAGYFAIGNSPRASVMGVHFKPGGAFPFLGIPPGDLANTNVSLDALLGAAASQVRQRLINAISAEARFRLLEAFLLARARRALIRNAAVIAALRAFEEPSLGAVAEVNERTGVSPKRLIALASSQGHGAS